MRAALAREGFAVRLVALAAALAIPLTIAFAIALHGIAAQRRALGGDVATLAALGRGQAVLDRALKAGVARRPGAKMAIDDARHAIYAIADRADLVNDPDGAIQNLANAYAYDLPSARSFLVESSLTPDPVAAGKAQAVGIETLFSVRWGIDVATQRAPALAAILAGPLARSFEQAHRYAAALDGWERGRAAVPRSSPPPHANLAATLASTRELSRRIADAMVAELRADGAAIERRALAYELAYSVALLLAFAIAWFVLQSLVSREKRELERLRADREIELREARFQSIFAESPLAIAIVDLAGGVLQSNAAYRRLAGERAADGDERQRLFEGIDVRPPLAVRDVLLALASGASSITGTDLELADRSGRRAWYTMNASSVAAAAENATAFSIVLQDITERKVREERHRHDAFHDSLTGLANRAGLREALEERLADAPVAAPRFALLYVDVDDFKTINDTLGHHSGDDCLQIVARRLTEVVREGDRVARIGGDEFVVLLRGIATHEAAHGVAARLRAIFAHPVAVQNALVTFSVSIGVALDGVEHATVEKLLADADRAMYGDKQRLGDRRAAIVRYAEAGVSP